MIIKSKLHNPIIAKNSYLENATIEKINNSTENAIINDYLVEGRIWFNSDTQEFKFANIDNNNNKFLDVFLSKTDTREQNVLSKINIDNSFNVSNGFDDIFTVDAINKIITTNSNQFNMSTDIFELMDSDLNTKITANNDVNKLLINYGDVGFDLDNLQIDVSTEFLIKNDNSDKFILDLVNDRLISLFANTECITDSFLIKNNNIEKIKYDFVADIETKNIATINNNSVKITNKISELYEIIDTTSDSNILTIDAANKLIKTNSEYLTLYVTNIYKLSDGINDKIVADNQTDELTINYAKIKTDSEEVINNTNKLIISTSNKEKIILDNKNNAATFNYSSSTLNGDVAINGNTVIDGNLTVSGSTTKVDIVSEELTIADNIIVLNSNLTNDIDPTDPTLASYDLNAGISVHRGVADKKNENNENIPLDVFKWVEDVDTRNINGGLTKVAIFNDENQDYELHQILDTYTSTRITEGKSGSEKIGYDGFEGDKYKTSDATSPLYNQTTYKIEAGTIKQTLDDLASEVEKLKYSTIDINRVGETDTPHLHIEIKHNLNTVFLDIKIQILGDDDMWYYDVVPIRIKDVNTIELQLSESRRIRYMITAINGFAGEISSNDETN